MRHEEENVPYHGDQNVVKLHQSRRREKDFIRGVLFLNSPAYSVAAFRVLHSYNFLIFVFLYCSC